MADIAFFVGALIPTGVLAALFVWITGRFINSPTLKLPVPRSAAANGTSLIVCTLIGAYGLADGGPPNIEAAFLGYLLPQAAWFVFWLFVLKGREGAAVKTPPSA